MTFEDMMQMRRLGATDVSPDGKWLLYSVTDVDLQKNTKINRIYIQEIEKESGVPQPKIVEGTQPGDDSARFAPDNKHLLFLSSRSGSQQIWGASFDAATGVTGIAQRVTNIAQCDARIAQCATPIAQRDTNTAQRKAPDFPESDNAIWSPDSKNIVFTAEVYPALCASYGGYMANWILGHTDRFKCIVTHDGMFNPESAYGSTEELWFNEWEFKTANTSGGKPWDYYGKPDSENPFRKWSPALSAKSFKTPTLVIHSQLDYRLDVSEGYQLFTTLQRLKVPSEMLYFPDEGHWVAKPQNSQLWYKTVNAWVDKWTKPKD